MKIRFLAVYIVMCILFTAIMPGMIVFAEETGDEPAPEETPAVTEAPTKEPDPAPTPEPTSEPTPFPMPTPTEEPVKEPTLTAQPTKEPAAEPTKKPAKLRIKLTTEQYSVFVGDTVRAMLHVEGGVAPYTVSWDGDTYTMEGEGEMSLSVKAGKYGKCKIAVSVKDSAGKSKEASVSVPVAEKEKETARTWEKTMAEVELTGDWHEDLVAIALTQLGYEESERNYFIDEDGHHAYTRYGQWYGSSYAEWCGMFVSFCLNYAEIPEKYFPRDANCIHYKEKLMQIGGYEDDEDSYEPVPGDLVFLNLKEKPSNSPYHLGIIEKVTEDRIYTIEGNNAKEVRRAEYARDDKGIVGYACMQTLVDRAAVLEADITQEPVTENIEGRAAYTNADRVAMRAEPSTEADKIKTIYAAGTDVTVLGYARSGERIWYLVECGGDTGYVRSDLVIVKTEDMDS